MKDTEIEDTDGVGRAVATDLAMICGIAFIGIGCWHIYEPAAYIVVGIILLAGAILAARG